MARQIFDLYSVLGAKPSADATAIRTKYRQAALHLHPDSGGDSEAFRHLQFAFEILSCPISRTVYDRNYACHVRSMKKCQYAKLVHAAPVAQGAARSKRPAPSSKTPESPPNHQCTRSKDKKSRTEVVGVGESMTRIAPHLSQLHHVLQDMKADQRRAALQKLAPHVRTALLAFMETKQTTAFAEPPPSRPYSKVKSQPRLDSSRTPAAVSSLGNKLSAGHHCASPTHKAQVHIKALRFYTCGHQNCEVALERQMILLQLHQALSAASAEDLYLWDRPDRAYAICLQVFHENCTSEHEIGLGAYVYLRAGHLLMQTCTIISPVMPLAEVLELHCMLLAARRTSWPELRAAWVKLMQCSHQPANKRKSLHEAEAIADAARADALESQLVRASKNVARALSLEELHTLHRRKMLAQKQARGLRKKAKDRKIVMISERRAARERGKAFKKQWQLCKGSDLTIDDIMYRQKVQV